MMLSKATKKELQEVVRRLSWLCTGYVRHITKTTGVSMDAYQLEDGIRCYGFIPYGTYDEVLYQLLSLRKVIMAERNHPQNKPVFLDIGCGIGNVVLLANVAGYTAHGLEYNPAIYKVAKSLCSSQATTIMKGDMRKFRKYKEYDVLYYYQPIINGEAMEKFTHKLAKAMKPGAYIMCHGSSAGFREARDFNYVIDGVYRKDK